MFLALSFLRGLDPGHIVAGTPQIAAPKMPANGNFVMGLSAPENLDICFLCLNKQKKMHRCQCSPFASMFLVLLECGAILSFTIHSALCMSTGDQ